MGLVELGFKVHRTLIAEHAVEPHPVVKDFDPLEDGRTRLGAPGEAAPVSQLAFQATQTKAQLTQSLPDEDFATEKEIAATLLPGGAFALKSMKRLDKNLPNPIPGSSTYR
jgi:hypothetical protein